MAGYKDRVLGRDVIMVIVWSDVLPPNNIYDLIVLDDAAVVLLWSTSSIVVASEYFQPTSPWTCNNFRVIQAGLINHT